MLAGSGRQQPRPVGGGGPSPDPLAGGAIPGLPGTDAGAGQAPTAAQTPRQGQTEEVRRVPLLSGAKAADLPLLMQTPTRQL